MIHRESDRSLAGRSDVSLPIVLAALLGAPVAWVTHFGLLYLLVTLYCTESWHGAHGAVLIATAVFAGLAAASGVLAFRTWQRRRRGQSLAAEIVNAADRAAVFLMVGVLGAVFFTLLILIEALPVLFVPLCPESG